VATLARVVVVVIVAALPRVVVVVTAALPRMVVAGVVAAALTRFGTVVVPASLRIRRRR
jgi:hypothetical protein